MENNKAKIFIQLDQDLYDKYKGLIDKQLDYIVNHCKELEAVFIKNYSSYIAIGGSHIINPEYVVYEDIVKLDFSDLKKVAKQFVNKWNKIKISEHYWFKYTGKQEEK